MSVDIAEADFEAAVLEKSHETPVLVDFWAEWCGPCRVLGPVLEQLESDMQGQFILAKLDTEANQEIAKKFQISSIPAVKLFVNGEVRGEFTGALPGPQVRSFLEKYLPNPEMEKLLQLARTAPAEAADQLMEKGLEGDATLGIYWLAVLDQLVKMTPETREVEKLKSYLAKIPEYGGLYSDAARSLSEFLGRQPGADPAHLGGLFQEGQESKTLDYFLKSFEEASGKDRDKAKQDILTCFFLLGNKGELVNKYRKKLSSLLY